MNEQVHEGTCAHIVIWNLGTQIVLNADKWQI